MTNNSTQTVPLNNITLINSAKLSGTSLDITSIAKVISVQKDVTTLKLLKRDLPQSLRYITIKQSLLPNKKYEVTISSNTVTIKEISKELSKIQENNKILHQGDDSYVKNAVNHDNSNIVNLSYLFDFTKHYFSLRDDKQKRFLSFTDKDEEVYFFIFSLYIKEVLAKLLIRIDKYKNTTLNIYIDSKKSKDINQREVVTMLKNNLKNKVATMNINFFDDKEEFIAQTSNMMNKNIVDTLG